MSTYEAAIIGAGPAGSAAARLLASWGHRVVVFDRGAGQAATLAESIPPSTRKLFAAIGVLGAVDGARFYRSTGNTVWWDTDEARVEPFASGERGYQVERAVFDGLLRRLAAAAGADLRDQTVLRVEGGMDAATLSLADQSELRVPFVLDCSGRSGVIARRRWRVPLTSQPRTVALAGVWKRPGGWPQVDPTHTLVESHGDGWVWSVPVAADTRYVTAMVDPQRTELMRGRPSVDLYRAAVASAQHVSAMLEDAVLERGPWGCDASTYVATRYAEGAVLLVGDAASFIDPLSSYGIKKALASGWLAAVAVHTALRSSSMAAPALEFFAAREATVASGLIEQTRDYFAEAATRHPNPFWTDRATTCDAPTIEEPDVRALRSDARVQQALAAIKKRSELSLDRGATLRIESRPLVRGHSIVFEDRLFTAAMPGGARFLRDVDLSGILGLAPVSAQVPDLFDAYNRRFPPVAMPDFLGALSVMLAFGMLEFRAGGRI